MRVQGLLALPAWWFFRHLPTYICFYVVACRYVCVCVCASMCAVVIAVKNLTNTLAATLAAAAILGLGLGGVASGLALRSFGCRVV